MEKTINFTKMTGAGNDFIIIDKIDTPLTPSQINKMCNRNFGIGADGLMIVSESTSYDFKVSFYNSDGFPGAMCGNGGRCVVAYAHQKNLFTSSQTKFQFGNDIYTAEVLNENLIKLYLNPPKEIKLDLVVDIGKFKVIGHYIDINVEHLIVFINQPLFEMHNSINEINVFKLGNELRNHPMFEPKGTNVNFIEIVNDSKIKIRTFEKGVENETYACGTGSVSSALIYSLKFNKLSPITVETFSRELFKVEFKFENKVFSDISLTGSAVKIFEGKYFIS